METLPVSQQIGRWARGLGIFLFSNKPKGLNTIEEVEKNLGRNILPIKSMPQPFHIFNSLTSV